MAKPKLDKDIIYNGYKEPLRKMPKGYGYLGVVSFSRTTGKIQCHLCGEFYETLQTHITGRHKMTHREYKQKTGLAYGTKLVSENYRKMLAERYEKIQEKLTPYQRLLGQANRIKKSVESNKKRKGQKINLETKNKRGTCPDQLVQKIKDLEKQLGEVPSKRQFVEAYGGRYVEILYKTFGSYPNAVKMAGMTSKHDSMRAKYSNENLLQYLRDFLDREGRPPRAMDAKNGTLPDIHIYCKRFGSWVRAKNLAFFGVEPTAHIARYPLERTKRLVDFEMIGQGV